MKLQFFAAPAAPAHLKDAKPDFSQLRVRVNSLLKLPTIEIHAQALALAEFLDACDVGALQVDPTRRARARLLLSGFLGRRIGTPSARRLAECSCIAADLVEETLVMREEKLVEFPMGLPGVAGNVRQDEAIACYG